MCRTCAIATWKLVITKGYGTAGGQRSKVKTLLLEHYGFCAIHSIHSSWKSKWSWLYTCRACVTATSRLSLRLGHIMLLTGPRTVLTMYKMFQNRCYTWFHNNWCHFFPNLSYISNCFKILSRQLGTPIKALNCKLHRILEWNNKLQGLKEAFLLAFLHLTYRRGDKQGKGDTY